MSTAQKRNQARRAGRRKALAFVLLPIFLGAPANAAKKPRITFSTLFPAAGNISAVAADAEGNMIVVGSEGLGTLTTVEPLQAEQRMGLDAFVAKIDPVSSTILFSTYLGGNGYDSASDVAVAPDGSIFVLGQTASADFPLVEPIQGEIGGNSYEYCDDIFLSRIAADGSSLLFSTFLGGSGCDEPGNLTVDRRGDIYLTGSTDSSDFPLVRPLQSQRAGSSDAFIVKIDAGMREVVFSTYLGGRRDDWPGHVAVNKRGRIWVSGTTRSRDFPTVRPLVDPPLKQVTRAWIAEIDPHTPVLTFSSLIGGKGEKKHFSGTFGGPLVLDRRGNAYMLGWNFDKDFPEKNGLAESLPCDAGDDSMFLVRVGAKRHRLQFSSCFGNSSSHQNSSYYPTGLVLEGKNRVLVVGATSDPDFPTHSALQENLAGGVDGLLAVVDTKRSELIWSTFLGGFKDDFLTRPAPAGNGQVLIVGSIESDDFPLVRPLDLPLPESPRARPAVIRVQLP